MCKSKKCDFCFCEGLFKRAAFTLSELSRKYATTGLPKIATKRDFWEEEERSAHASIAPWGKARTQPTAPTRGRFSKDVALERAI